MVLKVALEHLGYAGYKIKNNEGVEFATSHGDAKPLP